MRFHLQDIKKRTAPTIKMSSLKPNRQHTHTLTDFRQAREANICLTRDGRHMTPGLSLSMKISSSMSAGPNVQFLLVGSDTSLTRSITWATAAHQHMQESLLRTLHSTSNVKHTTVQPEVNYLFCISLNLFGLNSLSMQL